VGLSILVEGPMDRIASAPAGGQPASTVTDAEIPLTGGALHSVVRVGDTVRRPVGDWTPTIHALLRHVRSRGFDLAPEPIGIDDQGREVLGFLRGDTVGWSLPWPEYIRSDELLEQMGEAAARYHHAVADFRPAGSVPWQGGSAALGASEIVCHHDMAPYNAVLSSGRLVGLIDWDLAGPGTARSELAFIAWQWVPLHGPMVTRLMGWEDPPERGHRLRLLLDAYGLRDCDGFVDEVSNRISYNRETMVRMARGGNLAYQALIDQGHLAGMDEGLRFLATIGERLQDQLENTKRRGINDW